MNKILYGKDNTKNVVSIEIEDNATTIFTEDETGIKTTIVENRFWLLCNEKPSPKWALLKGNSHYKYGRQFDSREEWQKAKYTLKHKFDLFSIYDPKESFMVLKGLTYFKEMTLDKVSVLSFDIETTSINLDHTAKLLLISNTYRKNGIITKKLFAYDQFWDEGEMITEWCKWVRKMDPSIMIGHNINGFDIHYLKFIANKYDVELNLGRDGSALKTNTYESKKRKDGSQDLHYFKSYIFGREICDTLFLSINYDMASKKYVSYGLKQIIKQEGLEKANRTFYDASKIRFNYKDPKEWVKIKEYCKDDSDDALMLFDLMAPAFFYMTNYIPKSFSEIVNGASGSQINSVLVRAYLQYGHSIPKASEITPIKGGISLGNPGIYKNCWKLDIKSCYPSAILINKLYSKIKDPEAYMYKICEYFTLQRFEYKRLYKETKDSKYQALDQSAKIFINSIFGFCSAPGLNFNDPEVSAKITEFGRNYLNLGMKWATNNNSEYWINKNDNISKI